MRGERPVMVVAGGGGVGGRQVEAVVMVRRERSGYKAMAFS